MYPIAHIYYSVYCSVSCLQASDTHTDTYPHTCTYVVYSYTATKLRVPEDPNEKEALARIAKGDFTLK